MTFREAGGRDFLLSWVCEEALARLFDPKPRGEVR